VILDIRKLERPHRSGVIAVLIAYSLAAAWNMHVAALFPGEGSLLSALLCEGIPFVCMSFERPQKYEPPKEYEVTKLVYCPTCPVRKKEHHEGHLDTMHKGIVEHHYDTACSKDLGFLPTNVWYPVDSSYFMYNDKGKLVTYISMGCNDNPRHQFDFYPLYEGDKYRWHDLKVSSPWDALTPPASPPVDR
jgi:hypothetical protein